MTVREQSFLREVEHQIANVRDTWRTSPLVLGGTSGSGGGSTGVPGGTVGQLGQTRIAGDTDELRVLSSGSATSLLWNLNRIRYWETTQISASAPTPTFAGQLWINTSSGSTLNVRSSDDSAWMTISSGSSGGTTTGSGTAGQLALWDATTNLTGNVALTLDDKTLVIGEAATGQFRISGFGGFFNAATPTGAVYFNTADTTGTANVGNIGFVTGTASGTGEGGNITFSVGSVTNAAGGYIGFSGGTTSNGVGGSIFFTPGAGTTDGKISFGKAGDGILGSRATFNVSALTGTRDYAFPDTAGTFALGTGGSGSLAFWSGANTVTADSKLYWDSSNARLQRGASSLSTLGSSFTGLAGWMNINASNDGSAMVAMVVGSGNPAFAGFNIGGTLASPSATLATKNIARFSGRGWGSTALATGNRAEINFTVPGDWTDSSQPSTMVFRTTGSGSTTLTTQMTIGSDGVVALTQPLPASSGGTGINNASNTLTFLTSGSAALGAGTLTVSTTNGVTTNAHTHAITSSAAPGAAASLLATDSSGNLSLAGQFKATIATSGYLPMVNYGSLGGAGITVHGTTVSAATVGYACTVRRFSTVTQVATTNNASHYWTVSALNLGTGATIASVSTASDAADVWVYHESTGLSAALTTSSKAVQIAALKTGTPGALYLMGVSVYVE